MSYYCIVLQVVTPSVKIRILFIAIQIFMLAAFTWWTISLVNLSQNSFSQEISYMELEAEAAELKILQKSILGEFSSDDALMYDTRGHKVLVDSTKVNNFLQAHFKNKVVATYGKASKLFDALHVKVNEPVREQMKASMRRDERMYIAEGITFYLVVFLTTGWVFLRIKSILDLNRQQNNFLLSVTHELKTPIAAMKLQLQTLQRKDLPRDKVDGLVERSIQNADRLNKLVENVLVATKIETKNLKSERQDINLSDLVGNVVDEFKLKGEYNRMINTQIENGIYLIGDPFRIALAISNLVDNALKYSPADTEVDVRLRKENGKAILMVADQGPGIPEEHHKSIYKKFYRLGDENTRETKGTGLGLYIVKQVAKTHHGRVQIKKNNPKGTIFELDFKLNT